PGRVRNQVFHAIRWPSMMTWGRLSLGLLLLALTASSTSGAEPMRVLIVQSFGRGTPPLAMESTAFQTALTKELGDRVEMVEASLDMASYGEPGMLSPASFRQKDAAAGQARGRFRGAGGLARARLSAAGARATARPMLPSGARSVATESCLSPSD